MHHYMTRLHAAMQARKTSALVGLDPRSESLPPEIQALLDNHPGNRFERQAHAYEVFCRTIIDVISDIVPAVKPQVAFFEDCGPAGMAALQRVMLHARQAGLIVVADAKRGDIGSTAEAYASAWLAGADPDAAPYPSDSLTINAYLGPDTLEPFVRTARQNGAGLYVLVRTSNPQSARFQELQSEGISVCHHVAGEVERLASETKNETGYGLIGAVVGATHAQELTTLRALMPSAPFLIPGVGAQGASAADTKPAFDDNGFGGLVNSSRNIIFAYRRPEYSDLAREQGWSAAVAAAARDFAAELPVKAAASSSES